MARTPLFDDLRLLPRTRERGRSGYKSKADVGVFQGRQPSAVKASKVVVVAESQTNHCCLDSCDTNDRQ